MKTFITENFLLENNVAKELYFDVAENLPIIDYHNHLDANEILEDKRFNNLTEIWLSQDHYKWRLMRALGIEEKYITGDGSDYEKYLSFAKTLPYAIGNPLYHFTHLELLRCFDCDYLLNEKNAPLIWNEVNEKLNSKEYSTGQILNRFRVEFLATTDDPLDDLNCHRKLQGKIPEVVPTFRPDKALEIENPAFCAFVSRLGKICGSEIKGYTEFLAALEKRADYFALCGCRSADHSISVPMYEVASEKTISKIFKKRLQEKALSDLEMRQYKTFTLLRLGEIYFEKGWVMQLHMGALRNNNTKMLKMLGTDTGFDSIGNTVDAFSLSFILDSLEKIAKLPQTVLYSLHPADNSVLASMSGNFTGQMAGKVQFGSAWWFNDSLDGMENQLKTLANMGLISTFIGMLTDSRSFLSFTRHEYFRRILCNLLGKWATEGKAPKDMDLLAFYVRSICYENVKTYFSLKTLKKRGNVDA